MPVGVRRATFSEHSAIVRVAKLTKWTAAFSNQLMFSSPQHYARGWVGVALRGSDIVGFSCIREKVRAPEVVLYFVGVAPLFQRVGIGWQLITRLMEDCTHKTLVLKCAKDNPAKLFYDRHDFVVVADDANYWHMIRGF